jgi:hypothetical protein
LALSTPNVLVAPVQLVGSGTLSSGSFTPSANALVLVQVAVSGGAAATADWAVGDMTVTGGSGMGSWSLIQISYGATAGAANHIYYATAPASPASMTCSFSVTGVEQRLAVWEVTGHDTTTPIVGTASYIAATTTMSNTVTESPTADDLIIGTCGSRNTYDGASPGTNFTEFIDAYSGAAPSAQIYAEWDTGSTSTTVDATSFGTARNAWMSFIIKVASGTAKSGSDTSAGADTATVLSASMTSADTGAGSDAGSVTLTVTLTAPGETSTGTDAAVSIAQGTPDTATDTEAQSLSVTLPTEADTGSGSDAQTLAVTVTGSDTSTAVESESKEESGGTVDKNDADAPSGTEAQSLEVAMVTADTGSDVEAQTLAAALAEADTSAADDAALSVALDTSDTSGDTEAQSLTAALTSSDTGSDTEAQSLAAELTGSDTSTSQEAESKEDQSQSAELDDADTAEGQDWRMTLTADTSSSGNTTQYVDAIDATVNGNGTWATATNAVGSGATTYAVWTSSTDGGEGYLDCSVDLTSVPSGATIDLVTISVRHKIANAARMDAAVAQAFSGGTGIGSPSTLTESTSDHTDTFNITATAAQLRASDFMVRYTAHHSHGNSQSSTTSLDWISVYVEYTSGSTTTTDYRNPGTQASSGTEAQTLSATDIGADTGSDAEGQSLTAELTGADTAAGTDDQSLDTGPPEPKSGSDDPGSTEGQSLTATMATSDISTGDDAAALAAADSTPDTGGGTEAQTLVVSITASDTATIVDAVFALAASMADADVSSAVEGQSKSEEGATDKDGSETSGLSYEDALLFVTISHTETAAAADDESLMATLADGETVAESETAVLVVTLSVSEILAAALEAQQLGDRWNSLSANTTGSGVEADGGASHTTHSLTVRLSNGREAKITIKRLEG